MMLLIIFPEWNPKEASIGMQDDFPNALLFFIAAIDVHVDK